MKIYSFTTAAFSRMGVGRQLTVAFTLVLALVAALGALSLLSLAKEAEQARTLADKWLAGAGHLAEARASVIEMRDLEVKHSHTSDRSYQSEYEDKIAAAGKTVNKDLAEYKALVVGDDEAKLFATAEKAWTGYQKFSQRVLALGRDGKQADAADISDGASGMALDETLGALTTLSQSNFKGGQSTADAAQATFTQAKAAVLGLLAIALGVGAAMAMFITRGVVGQLGGEPRTAVQLARAVAAGDLSTTIAVKPGDTSSLMAALQAMQAGLSDAVRQVRQGSESVATASAQIAAGNHDLSGRTEQQASALQQTAATMD